MRPLHLELGSQARSVTATPPRARAKGGGEGRRGSVLGRWTACERYWAGARRASPHCTPPPSGQPPPTALFSTRPGEQQRQRPTPCPMRRRAVPIRAPSPSSELCPAPPPVDAAAALLAGRVTRAATTSPLRSLFRPRPARRAAALHGVGSPLPLPVTPPQAQRGWGRVPRPDGEARTRGGGHAPPCATQPLRSPLGCRRPRERGGRPRCARGCTWGRVLGNVRRGAAAGGAAEPSCRPAAPPSPAPSPPATSGDRRRRPGGSAPCL